MPGFPTGRKTTIAYTDGKSVMSADNSAVPAPAGLAYKTTSPGGATNAVAYLHNGDVASTTDADKLATSYAYDNLGRVATRTVAAPGGNLVTTFGYDGRNQVMSETDPSVTNRVSGAKHTPTTKTTFDADGNITAQTVSDSVAGGDAARKRTYTYNTHDQQATSVDPLGSRRATNASVPPASAGCIALSVGNPTPAAPAMYAFASASTAMPRGLVLSLPKYVA